MALTDVNTLFGVTSFNEVVYDEGAIINSYINIIMVPKRTRKFKPGFGSTVHTFLGRPVSPNVARQLRDALYQDLKKYQPRATITPNDIQINLSKLFNGYTLRISYVSRLSGSRSTVNLDLPAT